MKDFDFSKHVIFESLRNIKSVIAKSFEVLYNMLFEA